MSRRATPVLIIAAVLAFGPAAAQDRTSGAGSLAPPPPDPTAISAEADFPEFVMPDMDPKSRGSAKDTPAPAEPAKPGPTPG